ncbi:phytoene desaturase family protein [Mycobacterium decipiens]|uniref:Pyridine nucleotide-disulfide oxidoreductase domain-containing protein 2 n=1 Tax=Mycobacterium decipiens TaxID=1430326 RepID=A0A1X2LWN6_9MYCO|nr:NAD(P)/FAD-dependent oxidoreductase [Mycobacterium decipiens]OSC41478.1 dehydrogenase [Mycobacterium decipiens]
MTGYDAIVVGAGHNGLTAAVLLQRAGLRTVCLDAKRYAGGMAATVELFDGYRFEIAGSVQFPTSSTVSSELGLDTLPSVDLEVMSVALRGVGDDPVVQYTDPMKMLAHLGDVHGADAVTGMAGLLAWSQAPTRALGRFEAATPPKTFDEMYACATNEFERSAIDDMLFGSVTDVLDRYFPDREKHGALRGSFTVLAVNTLYRGPATPGSAAALAFGLGIPDGNFVQMKKLRGGIGTLTGHLRELLEDSGGEVRLRTKVTGILVGDGRVRGVRTEAGDTLTAPIVVSAIAPDVTLTELIDPAALPTDIRDRYTRIDHRGSYLQMHFALEATPTFAAPYPELNDPQLQASIGIFATPEQVQQQWEDCRRGIVPVDPTVVLQIPSLHDPDLAPAGKHAASAFALWFPIEGGPNRDYGQAKVEMGQRVIDKITRLAPNFAGSITRHTTFTPKHMGVMFGAPGGDYCHGLLHADQIGPNRPGPKGFLGQPIPIEGLYLGSAGCHGGPGITFIPGYNAAHQALADRTV